MKKHSDIFRVLVWPQERNHIEKAVRDYNKNLQIITLDVNKIVTEKDAHNDILDADIAELIVSCLSQIEQSKTEYKKMMRNVSPIFFLMSGCPTQRAGPC